MMPLIFANKGETRTIKRVCGKPEIKQHLESLGFVTGGKVTIITTTGSNLIVNVRGVRVAVSEEMARKIMV